jgi:DNA-binding IclR family transcriptional regulator
MTADVIKSAGRVFAILEYFRGLKRPATVGELAQALNLPQSSVSMLLKSMVTLGYLDYLPNMRAFLPTLRVALLGDWLQVTDPVAAPLTGCLMALQRATRETVILGRQNGPNVQYLSVLNEEVGLQLAVKNGMLRPMTLAAVGVMLLSTRCLAEVRGIIRRNNADVDAPELRVSERDFLLRLDEVRRQGFAETGAKLTAGATTIAMLVPREPGAAPLAVGVGGPELRIAQNRDRILEALRTHIATFRPGDQQSLRTADLTASGM